MLFAGIAVGAGPSTAAAKPVAGSFVGKLTGTNTLIAIVASDLKPGAAGRTVSLYFCDDTKVFEWFKGEFKGNTISLDSVSKDAHVQVTLRASGSSGKVDLPGLGKRSFTVKAAQGVSGLYLGSVSADGVVAGRSATGARIEGAIEGDRGVTGQLIPAQGNPVPFTFAGTDLKSVDFRLIVHPSGESRGARAARDNAHGFQLWEKST